MTTLVGKWPRRKAFQLREIILRLNICGCGGNAHWVCILELLAEAENHEEKGFYRDPWFEFGAKVLDSWSLLEHGVGIGYAWLTEDGELLLEFLRDFGVDEEKQAAWAYQYSWDETEYDDDQYSEWVSIEDSK